MSESRRTQVCINEDLQKKLYAALERDGIGERQISRWLCTQIAELMENDPTLMTVGLGEANTSFPIRRNITIDPETEQLLDRALRTLQGQDPRFVGATSALVRAAIKRGAVRHTAKDT